MEPEFKKKLDDKYKQSSRDRLLKISQKKIETTMIGALASFEEHFSYLWEDEHGNYDPSKKEMYELYQQVRNEVLNKGNTQSRNMAAELSNYEVKWLRYSMELPVVPVKK